MTAIAQLEENRTVEGIYAVAKKERLRTKNGAAYLALELVDPSGRISARVWNDVELLDTRFGEGDAVRVLGRVEKFRDRLQLDVRTLEPAPDRSVGMARRCARRRRARGLSSSSSRRSASGAHAVERSRPETRALRALPATLDGITVCGGCSSTRRRLRLETATAPAPACRPAVAAAPCTMGRTASWARPGSPDDEGRLSGTYSAAADRGQAPALDAGAVPACTPSRVITMSAPRARPEAAVLYHANQLDAVDDPSTLDRHPPARREPSWACGLQRGRGLAAAPVPLVIGRRSSRARLRLDRRRDRAAAPPTARSSHGAARRRVGVFD